MIRIRAVHFDLKWQHYRFTRWLEHLRFAASCGYNAVLLEYEDFFPYRAARRREHWRSHEIASFNKEAAKLGVQVIPMVQTIGHLGFALRRGLARLAEDPTEQDGVTESICPLNPDAVEMVESFIDEVITAHPDAKYIHLGGDEPLLGVCPKCRRRVARIGKGAHYVHHMNPLIERAAAVGKRPILWSDCAEHHPDALKTLDRRAVLCHWQYESTAREQDWAFVRAGEWSKTVRKGDSQYYWARRGCWSPTVTRHTLGGLPAEVRRAMEPYWSYRVKDYPHRFHGFAHLRYLKDRGFDVMYGSSMRSASKDNRFGVDYDMHLANCVAGVEAVREADGIGFVTTQWSASGFCPLELLQFGHAIVAKGRRGSAAAYERKQFGKRIGLLDAYRKLFACSYQPPCRFDGERFTPADMETEMSAIGDGPQMLDRMRTLRELIAWAENIGLKHREIEVFHQAACELLYKHRLALAWAERRMVNKTGLLAELRKVRAHFKKTFRRHYTPWMLEMESNLRFGAEARWLERRTRS